MSERTSTYTWSDLLAVGLQGIRTPNDEKLNPLAANLILNEIWKRYDWRGRIAVLPAFYLIPNEQDYGSPAVTIPSDFMGLRYANLIRVTTIPPWRVPLIVLKDLQITHNRGLPRDISYEPTQRAFRVFPRTPDNIGPPEYLIEGKYKKKPAKITAAVLASQLLPWDDIYFGNLLEVAKYIGYTLTNDQRAGTIASQGGQTTYSGQSAVMMQALESMANSEGLNLGEPNIAPSEGLVSGGSWGSINSIFGL